MNRKEGVEVKAAYFNLVGGPHHGNRVRMYAPWDDLVFEDGTKYTLHPPVGRDDAWVYIHTTEPETTDGT